MNAKVGKVRAVFTLAGAAAAGLLVWFATQIEQGDTGGYWAAVGLLAGAGLTMALSQLFGGWTKWGVPRVSGTVFLIGFLPVLVCAGWVLAAGQPSANWFQEHTTSWSDSVGIDGLVDDLRNALAVLAFTVGLVFGFTFDTSGPRHPREPVPPAPDEVSDTEVSDTEPEPPPPDEVSDTEVSDTERPPSPQG